VVHRCDDEFLVRHGASIRIAGKAGEPLFLVRQIERYFERVAIIINQNGSRSMTELDEYQISFVGARLFQDSSNFLSVLNADNFRPVPGIQNYADRFDLVVSMPLPVVSAVTELTVGMDPGVV